MPAMPCSKHRHSIERKTMKKNILIINPWIYDFKGFDEWSKPLGLLYIASILRNEGYNVSLINCLSRNHPSADPSYNESEEKYGCGKFPSEEIEKPAIFKTVKRKYKRYGISESAFLEDLDNAPEPDAIIVGSLITFWYKGPFRAIELARQRFPKIPIILGGIYATLCHEHAKKHSGADFVIKGHDMETLLAILSGITGNEIKRHIYGFGDYPTPAYNLLERPSSVPILTSMGCPFRCSYCASSILNGKFFSKDPAKLAEELFPQLSMLNIKDIAFYDDALLVNYEKHTGAFVSRLKDLGLSPRYHTPNAMHARYITEDTAISMKNHGFKSLRIGFEFIDEDMQKKTGGKTDSSHLANAAENLYKAGFEKKDIKAYILIGIPGTKPDSVERAIRYCASIGLSTHLSEYSPIPGTPMWGDFPGTSSDHADDPLFHNNTYHIYNETVLPLEEYNRLKTISRELNG